MTIRQWIDQFVAYLKQSGMPPRIADQYRVGGEFHEDAIELFRKGVCPADACVIEMGL